MVINNLHQNFHGPANAHFILFAFSAAINAGFLQAMKKNCECFTYFVSIGWAYLIQLLHLEVQWKSFQNQWAEASKTKRIDWFQTPAGRGITHQNSSQGSLKLVLQIFQPHIQTKKNGNMKIYFKVHRTHEVYWISFFPTNVLMLLMHSLKWGLPHAKETKCSCAWFYSWLFQGVKTRCSEVELSPAELYPWVPGGPLSIYLL